MQNNPGFKRSRKFKMRTWILFNASRLEASNLVRHDHFYEFEYYTNNRQLLQNIFCLKLERKTA